MDMVAVNMNKAAVSMYKVAVSMYKAPVCIYNVLTAPARPVSTGIPTPLWPGRLH